MIRRRYDRLDGAPFLNPFGNNTAAGTSYINSSKVIGHGAERSTACICGINVNGQREIFQTAAGPWTLAIGAEWRYEEATYTNNFALIRQAASLGLDLAEDQYGDRNVYALLAELNIPVLKNMEFNVALRYDDYSDVGSNVSPKIAFRWQALDNLLLRASYNQGFRAPTLYDIYAPNSITNTADPWDDPVLCPGGNPLPQANPARDCAQQFNSQGGGNKALQPETSESWSFGLVFDVTRNVSASVDYWNTRIEDNISVISENAIFNDTTKYANRFVRCNTLSPAQQQALDSQCFGAFVNDPAYSPLAYIVQTQENLGNIKAAGLDFSFQARSGGTEYGNFSLSLSGTYMLNYEQQLEKGGEYFSALGLTLQSWASRSPAGSTSSWPAGPTARGARTCSIG